VYNLIFKYREMVAENKRQGQVILFPFLVYNAFFFFSVRNGTKQKFGKQENSTGSVIHVISGASVDQPCQIMKLHWAK
jgi:hypothetical protein